jgi:hypothetical protein
VLQLMAFDSDGKVTSATTEHVAQKPALKKPGG